MSPVRMRPEFLESIEWFGAPTEKELQLALERGKALAQQVKGVCAA